MLRSANYESVGKVEERELVKLSHLEKEIEDGGAVVPGSLGADAAALGGVALRVQAGADTDTGTCLPDLRQARQKAQQEEVGQEIRVRRLAGAFSASVAGLRSACTARSKCGRR